MERLSPNKICPECAESVKAAANVCRFCGYRFEGVGQRGDRAAAKAAKPRVASDKSLFAVVVAAAICVAVTIGVLEIGAKARDAVNRQAARDGAVLDTTPATESEYQQRLAFANEVVNRPTSSDERVAAGSTGFGKALLFLAAIALLGESSLRRQRGVRWNLRVAIRLAFLVLGFALLSGALSALGSHPPRNALTILGVALGAVGVVVGISLHRQDPADQPA